jgi:hypothetical protein
LREDHHGLDDCRRLRHRTLQFANMRCLRSTRYRKISSLGHPKLPGAVPLCTPVGHLRRRFNGTCTNMPRSIGLMGAPPPYPLRSIADPRLLHRSSRGQQVPRPCGFCAGSGSSESPRRMPRRTVRLRSAAYTRISPSKVGSLNHSATRTTWRSTTNFQGVSITVCKRQTPPCFSWWICRDGGDAEPGEMRRPMQRRWLAAAGTTSTQGLWNKHLPRAW